MKYTVLAIITSLFLALGGSDLYQLVLTPTPQMHCEKCENKIKGNMRFEKGIVKIETSVEAQTVTITYDHSKTDAAKLQAAMKKIGYDTKVVSDKPQPKKNQKTKSEKRNR